MTKRKYLRLVSTGMVALGTLALGATAILPMPMLVKAADGNTPVVGNKDDLDSIEAIGKEAYAKAQAATAKVKTSTENAQTKRQEAEAKKQTQQTDAAAKNAADEKAKTAKANADNDAKTEKQTKKEYEDTLNAALKKNMPKERREALKSVLNNIKKDNKVKADKADAWDNAVKELDDSSKELSFSTAASKFGDLLNDDYTKGSLKTSVMGLMDNYRYIKTLEDAYNQAKTKAADSAKESSTAEQTAKEANAKAEVSSKAYQTSNEAANQAEAQLSADRAAAAQADEAYAAAKESLAKFAEGKKLTKVAADVRADKTSTFEQLVAKVRNALPKDTTPAPVPAPNPDPSGQGDNPANPANPAGPTPAPAPTPADPAPTPADPAPAPADNSDDHLLDYPEFSNDDNELGAYLGLGNKERGTRTLDKKTPEISGDKNANNPVVTPESKAQKPSADKGAATEGSTKDAPKGQQTVKKGHHKFGAPNTGYEF